MKKNIKFVSVILTLSVCSILLAVSRNTRDQAPLLSTHLVSEGQSIIRTFIYCDPDGNSVNVIFDSLPANCSISLNTVIPVDNVPIEKRLDVNDFPNAVYYSSTLTFNPNYEQSGSYTIFTNVIDSENDDDWGKIVINVTNTNRPPYVIY